MSDGQGRSAGQTAERRLSTASALRIVTRPCERRPKNFPSPAKYVPSVLSVMPRFLA